MTISVGTTMPAAPGSSTLPPALPAGFDAGAAVPTAGSTTTGGGYSMAPGKGSDCSSPVQQVPLGGDVAGAGGPPQKLMGGGDALGGGGLDLSGVLGQLTQTITSLTGALGGMANGGGAAPAPAMPAPGTDVAGASGGGAAPAPIDPNAAPAPIDPAAATPALPTDVAGATGGGAAPVDAATAGAAQIAGGGGMDMTAMTQALQGVIQALTALVAALQAQLGGATGGGAPGKGPLQGGGEMPPVPTDVAGAAGGGAPGKTPEQAPPGKMPAPMPAPTDVGGVQGPPAKVEAPPAKIVDPAPPVKAPPTQVAGDKGGPVQQAPTQVPTQVAGDKGGPVQQVPTQSPVQQSPIQGGGPVQGDVKLSDNDGRASAELKSASGNSVEIWGDPHVKMNLDGKTENFTIGYGPGSVQLTDGTTISWNTREDKHLGMFKVDRPGTAGDQQVDSKDGTNAKDLQTFLNDDQLREFGAALKSMEGPWDQPLKVPGGGPAQVPQK